MLFQRNTLYYLLAPVLLAACAEPPSSTPSVATDVETDAKVAVKAKPEVNDEPLDLSLSPEDIPAGDGNKDFSEQQQLSKLFEKKPKQEKFSVSGKPLVDAENPDYVDSVQGAEVTVKIKTM